MYIKNNKGPNILPCGIPLNTLKHDDFSPFKTTHCFLSQSVQAFWHRAARTSVPTRRHRPRYAATLGRSSAAVQDDAVQQANHRTALQIVRTVEGILGVVARVDRYEDYTLPVACCRHCRNKR